MGLPAAVIPLNRIDVLLPLDKEVEFIRETGIYCYAPPIGTAHGFYKATPSIRYDRMQQLVEAINVPMVLMMARRRLLRNNRGKFTWSHAAAKFSVVSEN